MLHTSKLPGAEQNSSNKLFFTGARNFVKMESEINILEDPLPNWLKDKLVTFTRWENLLFSKIPICLNLRFGMTWTGWDKGQA